VTLSQFDPFARDKEARGQIRELLDDTLFVEAGAGTGKTRALVDRVISLVLGGRPIERIIAITFTERAAAELSERIRIGLEAAVDEEPEKRDLIEAALAALDRAQISTIHSFCKSLLHRYAAEAAVDPSFDIQDEVMAARRFQERWRIFLDTLATDEAAREAIDRVLRLGMVTREIETLAAELTSRQELVSRLDGDLPVPPSPAWPDLDDLRRRTETLIRGCASADDKLCLGIARLLAAIDNIQRAPEGEEEAALVASVSNLPVNGFSGGQQQNWGGKKGKQEAIDEANAIAGELRDTLAALRSRALGQLIPLIVGFVRTDAAERARRGMITFDDLIVRVRDLLAHSEDAVRSLREQYDALLIDEFQDTDPLQVAIALAFARDPGTGDIEPGRLFLVGDPKQSIYRFRRADMAIYSQARESIDRADGRFPSLALNHRSRSAVLKWVNAVFVSPHLIGAGGRPEIQPPYTDIHPRYDHDLAGPGVATIGGVVDGASAREARVEEARAIAAQCLTAIGDAWQVWDRQIEGPRRAKLSDIAILIPTRGILPALERELPQSGVNYRVEGGSLVYRTQEMRDLTNCLTAIDDPADEVAIVGALRSPAFACSDVDLARHRAAGGRFNYLAPSLEDHTGPVADGLRVLARYHQQRHESSLAALVERFAAERSLVETGVLDTGDRNSFRRVRFLVDQARAFEAAEPASLRAFIRWLENRSDGRILDNEAAVLDAEDEDAVRITTVHGAKGLEYPIVFLAGLSWYPLDNRPPIYAVDRTTGEVAVCIGTKSRNSRFMLGEVERLAALESEHTLAEAARVLYVAATRARDHLIVSLYQGGHASSKSGASRLTDAGATQHAPMLQPPTPPRRSVAPFEGVHVDLPPVGVDIAAERQRLVSESRRRRYTSATALKNLIETAREEDTEPWARGRGGTRLGRAVHAAIQALPWDAGDDTIAAFSEAEAVAEAIPDRAADVARFVRRAFQSEAAGRARAAALKLREVPFGVVLGNHTVEGFIDLLIDDGDALEVVDWKTDQISAAEVDDRLENYKLQAGLYVLGIETATGRSVGKVTYVFTGPEIEISPGEPAELARLARLQLEATA
jgi:ATP-dependent helicase/nuclease subunit A